MNKIITLKLGTLVAVGSLLCACAPLTFWLGGLSSRTSRLELTVEAHQLVIDERGRLFAENDAILKLVAENQKRIMETLELVRERVAGMEATLALPHR